MLLCVTITHSSDNDRKSVGKRRRNGRKRRHPDVRRRNNTLRYLVAGRNSRWIVSLETSANAEAEGANARARRNLSGKRTEKKRQKEMLTFFFSYPVFPERVSVVRQEKPAASERAFVLPGTE